MIRRLVEQSYFGVSGEPAPSLIEFWLRELRSPEPLLEVARVHPNRAHAIATERPAVAAALHDDTEEIGSP